MDSYFLIMENYTIIGWPEIQDYMDKPGFEENSTIILINEKIGIGSCTYLISNEWLENL